VVGAISVGSGLTILLGLGGLLIALGATLGCVGLLILADA
jgi:hypothetical protein